MERKKERKIERKKERSRGNVAARTNLCTFHYSQSLYDAMILAFLFHYIQFCTI